MFPLLWPSWYTLWPSWFVAVMIMAPDNHVSVMVGRVEITTGKSVGEFVITQCDVFQYNRKIQCQ